MTTITATMDWSKAGEMDWRKPPDGLPLLTLDEYLQDAKSGDILFCWGNYRVSKIITSASKGPSHVACNFWAHIGTSPKLMVGESVEDRNTDLWPFENYMKYDGRIYIARHDEMTKAIANVMADKAYELMGVQYGTIDLLSILLRIKLGVNLGNSKALVCSEYFEKLCQAVGWTIPRGDTAFVSPRDVLVWSPVKLIYEIWVGE